MVMSINPSIVMRPGTIAEIDEAAHVLTLARALNPFEWACYPAVYSNTGQCGTPEQKHAYQDLVRARAGRMRKALQHPATDRFQVAVVVEIEKADDAETPNQRKEKLAGFAQWNVLPHGVSEQEWALTFAKCRDSPAQDDALLEWNPVRKRIRGVGIPHIYLAHVNVLPDFRGHGIGKRLTKVALDEADAYSLPVYTDSTPDGFRIYPSLGFTTEYQSSRDLQKYGVNELEYWSYGMLRKPQNVSQS